MSQISLGLVVVVVVVVVVAVVVVVVISFLSFFVINSVLPFESGHQTKKMQPPSSGFLCTIFKLDKDLNRELSNPMIPNFLASTVNR